jgi:drug/metabolite transporter (DMT)-like permease
MTGMIVTSLAAAGLYGAAAAVEQRQAERAPEESAGRFTLLVHLARNPLWLLGFAAQFGGFAVHAAALRSGPLATVQMLIATELIVAVLLVQFWSGRKPSVPSAAAALTVVAGIAAFLFLTTPPGHGHRLGHGLPSLTLLAALLLGGSAAALVLAGLRAAGCRRAVLLALAAGAGDACSAVVTMAFTHVIGHGLASVATSWTTYAVIVAGVANILLTQTAYQAGRPLITLPLISAIVPVASVAVGVGLLGEAPRVSLASGVGAGVAVLVTSAALAVLARSAPAGLSPDRPCPLLPSPRPLPTFHNYAAALAARIRVMSSAVGWRGVFAKTSSSRASAAISRYSASVMP